MKKQIVYVDMDNVACDFIGARDAALLANPSIAFPHSQLDFFRSLKPMKGFIEAINLLATRYDVYFLTAPSTKNLLSYTEKALWVRDHLGEYWVERLIISKFKNLNKGDFLIDDIAEGCGQDKFEGTLIQFGTDPFFGWREVLQYMIPK